MQALSYRRSDTHARQAFTLVELLVVIGIIALLMSILLPTLGRVKQQANRIKCASNIRQIGLGFVMYTDANRGYAHPFRNDTRWMDPSNPTQQIEGRHANAYWGVAYAEAAGISKQVFQCPSEQTRSLTGGEEQPFLAYALNSYGGQNSGFSNAQRIALFGDANEIAILHRDSASVWQGRNISRLRHKTRTIFAMEAYETVIDGNGDTFVNWYQWPGKEFEWLRHNKEGNAVFADGHVETLDRDQQSEVRYYTGRW